MKPLETVEGAILIAVQAHAGQADKQGVPYILHAVRVGASLWQFGEEAVIAGILHDVVEDTAMTLDDLEELGASEAVIKAVESVTKTESESTLEAYEASIRRAMKDPIGLLVKASDVSDNASRLDTIADEELKARLTAKYEMAVAVLREEIPDFVV
jgi:(p)ppGpp synthase/HD superfamily hydrolase